MPVHFGSESTSLFLGESLRQLQESLIDRIDLNRWHLIPQDTHHPGAHVPVERVVTAEDLNSMLPDYGLLFVQRSTHRDPEGFCLLTPGNDAPVIVREHNDGLSLKSRIEDPLAGTEEVIAVNEAEAVHGFKPYSIALTRRQGSRGSL
jgi:hypothetical protein